MGSERESTGRERVPEVAGGILLECVAGPLDGYWIFLPGGDCTVDVGHFFDERRTPWVGGVRPGAPNYLGYYSPGRDGFVNGGVARWTEFHSEIAESVRKGETP